MLAQYIVYQELFQLFQISTEPKVRPSLIGRLVLFVLGMMAARSCVVAEIAREIETLALSKALTESVERRLRRILSDPRFTPEVFYQPLLRKVINWQEMINSSSPLVLVVDDTSKEDEIHTFRISLAYQGRAVPLAWALWQQNVKMPSGAYWNYVDEVLGVACSLLPADLKNVIVVADGAFACPAFIDRIARLGWHWIVRTTTEVSVRFVDHKGYEQGLARAIKTHVWKAGMRWKVRGKVFKDAGWRKASVVAMWGSDWKEPLAVITDLRPAWEVLALYERRFWVEASFRDDKSYGWCWEDCQVKGVEHHKRLVLVMAIASLLTLCLGLQEARARVERLITRVKEGRWRKGKPRRAKLSLFALGLVRVQKWLHAQIEAIGELLLTGFDQPSWQQAWHNRQGTLYVFNSVPP